MCGEHPTCFSKSSSALGSSPRVRGTQAPSQWFPRAVRIIPACAGNTMSTDLTLKNLGDHPRVCGEHELTLFENGLALGSSPRVRGTPVSQMVENGATGIIPACAGNTRDGARGRARSKDHPRVCGEHERQRRRNRRKPGSSPRVRGTPSGRFSVFSLTGIIPACAGNTLAVPMTG